MFTCLGTAHHVNVLSDLLLNDPTFRNDVRQVLKISVQQLDAPPDPYKLIMSLVEIIIDSVIRMHATNYINKKTCDSALNCIVHQILRDSGFTEKFPILNDELETSFIISSCTKLLVDQTIAQSIWFGHDSPVFVFRHLWNAVISSVCRNPYNDKEVQCIYMKTPPSTVAQIQDIPTADEPLSEINHV